MHDPLVVAHEIMRPWPQRSSWPATGSAGDGVRWRVRLYHTCGKFCDDEDSRAEARTRPGYPNRRQRRSGKPCGGTGPFPWHHLSSYSRFWRLAGRDVYWPAMITIWHREPRGRDSGEVCPHHRRWQDEDGQWKYKTLRAWRWHVHHWRIQVPPAQHARRWLLTRCAWCGGPSRKGDPVNVSHQWNGPRGRWWRGERGLYHMDCSTVATEWRTCLCPVPVLPAGGYGQCQVCGRFRAWRQEPDEATRLLAALPEGARMTPELRARLEPLWAARRAARKAREAAGE